MKKILALLFCALCVHSFAQESQTPTQRAMLVGVTEYTDSEFGTLRYAVDTLTPAQRQIAEKLKKIGFLEGTVFIAGNGLYKDTVARFLAEVKADEGDVDDENLPKYEGTVIDKELTPADLELITSATWLTAVWIIDNSDNPVFTDAHLSGLLKFPELRFLKLIFCKKITDSGLEHLTGVTPLKSLGLTWCGGITDSGLEHLAGLPQLKSLDLASCDNIASSGLEHLAGLTQLKSLDLSGGDGVTDSGLKHLAGLPQLESLELSSYNGITDSGLEHLAGLT